MQPHPKQVDWLREGKAKSRLAIYLDTAFMLSDKDGDSIEALTISPSDAERIEQLRDIVSKVGPLKVSIMESPNAWKLLEPLRSATHQKMQNTLRYVLLDTSSIFEEEDGKLEVYDLPLKWFYKLIQYLSNKEE
jgi:hypothetical protein